LVWWSDLCSIGREFDVESNWISLVIQRALGSRNNTLFWKDWWIGEQRLNIRFSHLHSVGTEKYHDCHKFMSNFSKLMREIP
jgi:hypothetical protein